ncbi:MAG: 4-(cytidine 5'-diphospho)-2-C-methyl-D-erythritol kinase [Bacteroidales bacterium]|jgi:4-diphosphocytidyl-2-C-methyl-D-erythritol kinase|nr:4-(cytidine 5'-diphospho)-2-C-methyl-D-erythritol kinase [Bacteroidales bacterium]
MISYPNPKINIGLLITEKRVDGFHNLETIFYPIDHKKDTLVIEQLKEEKTMLTVENFPLTGGVESNLCIKAYRLLQTDFNLPEVEIHLNKQIPVGAGLGGGSADAAFTLCMLNELFNLHLSEEKLQQYAARLGSDVPFFIQNRPMYAYGRGELMEPIALDLSHKVITVITPDIAISTAEAYAGVKPKPATIDLRQAIQMPISEWKNLIVNDFEETIFKKQPLLREIKEDLYKKGADYASLSGSGSSIFAIGDQKFIF